MDTVHECDRQTDRQTKLLSQIPCSAERRTVKRMWTELRDPLKFTWWIYALSECFLVLNRNDSKFLNRCNAQVYQYMNSELTVTAQSNLRNWNTRTNTTSTKCYLLNVCLLAGDWDWHRSLWKQFTLDQWCQSHVWQPTFITRTNSQISTDNIFYCFHCYYYS